MVSRRNTVLRQRFSKKNNPFESCSFMIDSRMFIAGAHESPFNRHVYRVGPVGYDRMADLPFDFDEGRCEGFPDKALLCAPDNRANVNNDKKCWWYMTGTI